MLNAVRERVFFRRTGGMKNSKLVADFWKMRKVLQREGSEDFIFSRYYLIKGWN